MCILEESYKKKQKIQILKFWECPLYEIWEYAFMAPYMWCNQAK